MQNEIRKGVNQAKQSEQGANWFFAEIFIIAVVSGFYFSSWWVFGGILLASILLAVNKKARFVLLILLTVGCGAVGWIVGSWFNSTGASIVLTIFSILISGGYHIWAYRWMEDN
ncbi:hypothetical protein [Paenibacillus odorifer]|uniref:hypothetical protein n=1 Tax=Paenibacillus odorifer TaxID=189426 RepID=UPI002DC05ED0|nr:hypothetical protein [Paenibacillus odorifer]MEC0220361.1 hypothetical protein [Paenibacillus odorifer]